MDILRIFSLIISASVMFVYFGVIPARAELKDEIRQLNYQLSNKDDRQREEAIRKLVKIGSPAVSETINTLKNDENYLGRMNAAKVLGLIGSPEAVKPLLAALQDEYLMVQQESLISLGCIGKKSVTPEIIDFIQDNTDYFRKLGSVVLGQLGDERAIPLLEEFTYSEDPGVAQTARDALNQINIRTKRETVR
jgi:HEAT repeat protein